MFLIWGIIFFSGNRKLLGFLARALTRAFLIYKGLCGQLLSWGLATALSALHEPFSMNLRDRMRKKSGARPFSLYRAVPGAARGP